MNNEEIRAFLKRNTNMSDHNIDRRLADGVSVHQNSATGYEEYKQECIGGLCDEEEISGMWDKLEIIGEYKFDWVL